MAYTKLTYQIVFSTKERRPFLQGDVFDRVCDSIGGILREQKAHAFALAGMPDHLHLAVLARPTVALADLIRTVKANSSRWIHAELPELRSFSWQETYSAFSVLESAVPDVVRYVRGQQKHHQKLTFREELIVLLTKHGVEYDPRYIWS
ncbi:MAG: IS200/IS605 family transposase [Planctomycetota bacterium]